VRILESGDALIDLVLPGKGRSTYLIRQRSTAIELLDAVGDGKCTGPILPAQAHLAQR
jgi:hypothetical protein